MSGTTIFVLAARQIVKGSLLPHSYICTSHEFRHGRMSALADAVAAQHLRDRHPENLEVKPDAAIINVPNVQLELLFPGKAVASVHLHPARDTRYHLMPTSLERRISGQVFGKQRPRADETHIAPEYVPELWQFIEARAAKEPSQPREPLCIR